jgi:hypothetical protein
MPRQRPAGVCALAPGVQQDVATLGHNQGMEEERPGAVPAQSTGDPRVDEAIAGLGRLRDLPLDSQPAALETVHDTLREILGELGEAGAAPRTPREDG